MFEPIAGLPEGVIGFDAVGKVEASDYEDVLMPAIARGAARGEVRLVLVLGDRFTGYSPGAMKEDAGLVSHAEAWKRTAVVSDLGWVAHLSTAFGWMVPGEFKRFGLADRDAAIAWVAQVE
jgi:SpoIIAA-like